MKLQKDDARLLQYVLNEISATDLQVVNLAIASQPEIAAEVQSLKNLYTDISNFESEPKNLKLSTLRKQKLFQQTIYKEGPSSFSWLSELKKWRYATGGLVAATFALMVFTHSLKDEVKEQARFDRPTIPADSAVGSKVATQALVEKKSKDANAPEVVTEHDLETSGGGQIGQATAPQESESRSRKQLSEFGAGGKRETKEESALADAAESPAANSIVAEEKLLVESEPALKQAEDAKAESSKDMLTKKKMFTSSKAIPSIQTGKGLPAASIKSSVDTSFGIKGLSAVTDFDILISSRALEAEQIKALQASAKDCLQSFRVSQELKIMFDVQSNKHEITNVKPSATEKQFAECTQKFVSKYLPKSIKIIYYELKSVSK